MDILFVLEILRVISLPSTLCPIDGIPSFLPSTGKTFIQKKTSKQTRILSRGCLITYQKSQTLSSVEFWTTLVAFEEVTMVEV